MTTALPGQLGITGIGPSVPKRVQPFLRWTGGKRALVDSILPWLPERFGTYHEPFMGSAALFFALRPRRAFLSDLNARLVCTFAAIQQELPRVIECLRIYEEMYKKHGAAFYMHVRDINPDTMEVHELAAWFIFTNKTGFNGIYRVNSSGKYNVPAGKFTSPPVICPVEALESCSAALQTATIIDCSFKFVEDRAQPGDLVYFDPPYVPLTATADFTSYTAEGFRDADQVALRDLARRLKKKGVHVVLSNSGAPRVRELYSDFEIREVSRRGTISSNTEGRGRVTELLIR